MQNIISILIVYGLPAIVFISIVIYVLSLRRIVPTNMVHIVQKGKQTVSYGKAHAAGNVYYEFPKWMPFIGIIVRELPVSNFDIDINDYVAYDKDRLPFMLHVKAFFHIADTNKAAEKVESYADLKNQLENIVKGAIRSILANETLHKIMEERTIFGKQFTDSVDENLKQWGVESVKNIELMDIKDDKTSGSTVIEQIMAMKKSAIDMESRSEIAKNRKSAQQAELEAQQAIDVTKAETERISGEAEAKSFQAIGIARAEAEKQAGIAKQQAVSDIAQAERLTAEQQMEVVKVNKIKQAEIDKESAIIDSEKTKKQIEIVTQANKFKTEMDAEAQLLATKKEAEGVKLIGESEAEVIKAKGLSEAEAKKQMELAGVTAQTTLAKEIGENESYQNYLIKIREVEITGEVNKVQYQSLATALNGADLKLLVNSGDVHSGLGKFSDILSSKGGAATNGLIEGLKQTAEGAGLVALLDRFTNKDGDKK